MREPRRRFLQICSLDASASDSVPHCSGSHELRSRWSILPPPPPPFVPPPWSSSLSLLTVLPRPTRMTARRPLGVAVLLFAASFASGLAGFDSEDRALAEGSAPGASRWFRSTTPGSTAALRSCCGSSRLRWLPGRRFACATAAAWPGRVLSAWF